MNRFWFLVVVCLFVVSVESRRKADSSPQDDKACNDSVEDEESEKTCRGRNEQWLPCGKYKYCEPTCGKLYTPCLIRYKKCPEGCQCIDGYARCPKTGNCIPEKNCSDFKTCPRNEEYKKPGQRCEESCDENRCAKTEELPENGCFCKEGFARIGEKCQPRKKCKCPKNMVWNDFGTFCTDHCDKEIIKCKAIPKPGCYCSDGFARINGTCLSDDLCEHHCGDNEDYQKCGNSCMDYCDPTCDEGACAPGCYCLPGFKRPGLYEQCQEMECDSGNVTTTEANPNDCSDPNESYVSCDEGKSCEYICGYSKRQCYKTEGECESGCRCLEGYFRDKKSGVCVKMCSDQPKCESLDGCGVSPECKSQSNCECPPNSSWSNYGTICHDHCLRDLMNCPPIPISRCYCDIDFANINGTCKPRSSCPKPCGDNEEYLSGGSWCQDKCNLEGNCKDLKVGCFCIKGYKRNSEDTPCFPEHQCIEEIKVDDPCPKGEVYLENGPPCDNECSSIGLLCSRLKPLKRCYCPLGFARNKDGNCIPTESCPNNSDVCEENEVWMACGTACAQYCGAALDCDRGPRIGMCISQCFCKPGFQRNKENECIPISKC